jgi:hypothetical protein
MNTIGLLNALDIQKYSLQAKLLDKNISVAESETINDSITATILSFKEHCLEEYFKFRKFCQSNRNLYTSFSCMFRDTDRIVEMELSVKKQAIFILLENTFDNCCQRSVVLVPFNFIESETDFLLERTEYVRKWHLNHLNEQIAFNLKKIDTLKDENKLIQSNIDNFDKYFSNKI